MEKNYWKDFENAAKAGDVAVIAALADEMRENGRDLVSGQDDGGNTALHVAAGNFLRATAIIEFLIARGADPNAQNNDGNTVLHSAMGATDYYLLSIPRYAAIRAGIFSALLAAGADPRIANGDDDRPLDWAATNDAWHQGVNRLAGLGKDSGGEGVTAMLMAKAQELDLRDRAAARLAGADIERGGGL